MATRAKNRYSHRMLRLRNVPRNCNQTAKALGSHEIALEKWFFCTASLGNSFYGGSNMHCPNCTAHIPLIRSLRPTGTSFECPACRTRVQPDEKSIKEANKRIGYVLLCVLMFITPIIFWAGRSQEWLVVLSAPILVIAIGSGLALWIKSRMLVLERAS